MHPGACGLDGEETVTGFPPEVRDMVALRAVGCCERCHFATQDMEFHHRRPRGMGGSKADDTNVASNCLLLCGACHRDTEAQRTNSLHYGWLVRQGKCPAEVPIWMNWRWMFLNDDGTATERGA
jgi:5-methylcytosine-specific restriction enzyme A